jgi:hypothetical protein
VYAGLISGYNNGLFGPDDPITREQMAAMVARALLSHSKLALPNQADSAQILAVFQDRQAISGWAGAEVALAVQQGIIHGKTAAIFAPQARATRAEAAVMVWQLAASMHAGGSTSLSAN